MPLRISWIVRPREEDADAMQAQRAAVEWLRERGHRVRPYLTFEAGDAVRMAERAARRRADLIVAVGGDGTIHEVVNGIVRSEWQPRIGIVPAGTANDFASGLTLPRDPVEAAAVAVSGRPTAVDVAFVNGRCFINVSTGGFGAEATEGAAQASKRRWGPLAYLWRGARKLAELDPYRARFDVDGEAVFDGDFLFFAVGNARQTGGGSHLTPVADRADGRLDLVIVKHMPTVEFMAMLPDIRAGRHLASPDVLHLRGRRISVDSAMPLPVNADGEAIEGSRFEYSVLERPLSLMLPA